MALLLATLRPAGALLLTRWQIMGLANISSIPMGFKDFLILAVIGVSERRFGLAFLCSFSTKTSKHAFSWVIMNFKYFGSLSLEI